MCLGPLALLALGGTLGHGQTASPGSGPPIDGQQLVAQSSQRLASLPSLEVKLRQRVDLFGQEIVGSGLYLQKRSARGLLLRLELKLSVAGQLTSLQQVCDGRFLWIRRDLPSGAVLSRVDLERIGDAVKGADGETWPDSTRNWLALGGLPRLMTGLAENFQFGAPTTGQLGDTTVWIVQGQWQRDKLVKLLPAQQEAIMAGRPADLTRLPPHLPSSVVVALGQDSRLPLRIDYRRVAAGGGDDAPSAKSVVVLDLLDMRRRDDLEDRFFTYEPGNQEVADHTSLYLQGLRLFPPDSTDR
jgi:hypothetical protein